VELVYRKLLEHYGPQDWWPGDSPVEILIGAVLTQNTSWKNVEKAIANLRDARLIHLKRLDRIAVEDLAEIIRPSGYFRLKAKRLKNLVAHIMAVYQGDLASLFALPVEEARTSLLSVNGVGPETADSILLYAGDRLAFVVDTYTARIFKRHAWIDQKADYHQLQALLTSQVPADVSVYNEYHALIVRAGNEFCRKQPNCSACPLKSMLPPGGVDSTT